MASSLQTPKNGFHYVPFNDPCLKMFFCRLFTPQTVRQKHLSAKSPRDPFQQGQRRCEGPGSLAVCRRAVRPLWMIWWLSSFSTQHAQRCVPARECRHTVGLLSRESCECIFLNKRNAFGDLEAYRGPKTEPQRRMHFFRFTNRLLPLVLLNSCLNYCCLRNCLRPQRSPPASSRHGVKPRFWARGTTHPVQRPHAPMPEAAENTPAAENCLSSSSLH